jgi:hypothetical protein
MVFARIVVAAGDVWPFGYPPYTLGTETKQLRRPFPALYSVKSSNPLESGEAAFPILTDANGKVSFSDMKFSSHGKAGLY